MTKPEPADDATLLLKINEAVAAANKAESDGNSGASRTRLTIKSSRAAAS